MEESSQMPPEGSLQDITCDELFLHSPNYLLGLVSSPHHVARSSKNAHSGKNIIFFGLNPSSKSVWNGFPSPAVALLCSLLGMENFIRPNSCNDGLKPTTQDAFIFYFVHLYVWCVHSLFFFLPLKKKPLKNFKSYFQR